MSNNVPFPWRRLRADALYVTILNVLCALMITAVMGRIADFGHNLVFSVCIGTTALLLVDGLRLHLIRRGRRLALPVWLIIGIVGATFAQYSGTLLASWLLGWPMPSLTRLVYSDASNMLVVTLMISGGLALFLANRERLLRAQAALVEERARAEAIGRQAAQTQLRLLQAQIEPHMLFNTLANVQGLIAIDPPAAERMLDQFVLYLRATLTSSRAEQTTLAQEFALMEAYLGLMSVRMGARLQYRLDLPPSLRAQPIPPMLLQPLIENAIVHGIEPKIEGGKVTVSAARNEDTLTLRVTDTGIGLGQPGSHAGAQIGLANTHARLHALFADAASVTLTSNHPAGAIACLTLPA